MVVDTTTARSRRAILGASLGAIAATLAGGLARPAPARATDDDPMVVGGEYSATSATKLTNAANASDVLVGESTSGVGVRGSSATNDGMLGSSTSLAGVHGFAGAGSIPAPSAKTGVYGRCDIDFTSRGVSGASANGSGVYGTTGYGAALHGVAASARGFGLRTSGRLDLRKASGLVPINAGAKSVYLVPGIDMDKNSFAIATLNGSAGGTTTVHRVEIDTTANTITIYLTANATQFVRVAWLVLG